MAAEEAEGAGRAHQSTYHFFIGLMKYGAVIAILVAFMVIFIIRN